MRLRGPGLAAQHARTANRTRAHAAGPDELVGRARQAGALRQDVTALDVPVGLAAIASFGGLRPHPAAASTGRLVELLLAGLSAPR